MELNINFGEGNVSADMQSFLSRIESTDPNSLDVSEDETNTNWGHWQLTSGGCPTACRLIAASVKTCKVARQLCVERKISATSFISDIYLQHIVSWLWELWREADGPIVKGKNKVPATTTEPSKDSAAPIGEASEGLQSSGGHGPGAEKSHKGLPASEITPVHGDSEILETLGMSQKEDLEKLLQALVKDNLKGWIMANNVTFPPDSKSRNKPDLISTILNSPASATEMGFRELQVLSAKQRGGRRSKKATEQL
ncbi:hypothetical protein NLJ89_g3197 [Agrocybe chaxingu]|uniref:Uncharacterized protein n=1 Tax=Agrocybe chaxingu TaxID=84603 RepID=A0A9W8K5S2_9AGAR|nr:hypothetical protein NLJ89_g3197 [Agrocybe chaxingu]